MSARSDNFNRADGTFNGSTPSDGGSAWVASSIWSIIGNQVGLSSAPGAREIALLETSATAGEAQCTMAVRRNSGPCVRGADVSNHVVLYAITGAFAIYKKVSGTYTQLGSTYTGTVSNGDVVKLAVNSSNEFRAYLNGTLRVGPVTDSAGSTNTKAGFEALSNGSTDRIEDWSWADAAAASTSNPAMCAFPRAILNF